MDIHGNTPTSKVGEYFRASIFQWPRLWGYCQRLSPEITGKIEDPFVNEGLGLDELDACRLANIIRDHLRSPEAGQYLDHPSDTRHADGFVRMIEGAAGEGTIVMRGDPTDFDLGMLDRFANFLEHSGGFQIW
jgi:hypothetical protein